MLKIYMLFLLVIEFLFFVCLYIIKWGKKILGYIVEINYMEIIFLLYCKDENDIIKFNI